MINCLRAKGCRVLISGSSKRPRSWYWPLYDLRGGLNGAGACTTDPNIAANIERGFSRKLAANGNCDTTPGRNMSAIARR